MTAAEAAAAAERPRAQDPEQEPEEGGQADEQVSGLASEYRAELGRILAERKLGACGPLSDLGLAAEECCAEPGGLPASPGSCSVSSSRRSSDAGTPAGGFGIHDAVIIFDWDDTLFPTWFVQEVVRPCVPGNAWEARLPAESPFREPLAAHASAVRAVLTVARAVAQVAIVTLAMRPWVLNSAERFLPGLDLPELLLRLGIPVLYAREHVKRPDACLARREEGVDVFTVAKRATMLKCLRKLYGKRPCPRMNVTSVGDSPAEKDAIKEVLWAASEQPWLQGQIATPLCKTVQLIHQPSVQQLGDELHLLATWLRRMASHGEDFDICVEEPEDINVRGRELFAAA